MVNVRKSISVFGFCLVTTLSVHAGELLQHSDGPSVPLSVQGQAMPELDSSQIGRILTRYYNEGLGGVENWDQVQSLWIRGTLTLSDGAFELSGFQKKPNYIKIKIGKDGERSLILSYDGVDAWQQSVVADEMGLMSEAQARRFAHSAQLGSHLLYPFKDGKVIEFVDTVPLDGAICHHLRVRLKNDYQVDYYIDIRTYLELKVVNTDLRSGFVNSVVYGDYVREFGIPVAKSVQSYEGGTRVSSLALTEIKMNTGLMPWMFSMPE